MRAGTLRQAIDVYDLSSSKDQYGAPTTAYIFNRNVRCNIVPIQGNEEFLEQVKNTITHKIIMRYTANNPTPEDQLRINNRIFDIVSVINVNEENRDLLILANEQLYKEG